MSADAGRLARIRPELAKLSTPIDELMPHPDNPRRGNVDAIAEPADARSVPADRRRRGRCRARR
jgi:hypothetical protein